MLSFFSKSEDIFFNLAAEEFLLRKKIEDYYMLWQSADCIVVGKHQNALAEINHNFVRVNAIPVARRLTGGGTVYHGKGNLNFSFIRNGKSGQLVDFRYFIAPIVDYLHSLGVKAEIGEKNDILINGMKISGNAEHIYKERVLHHGTLLFNADLRILDKSIRVIPGRFIGKAVQSNRSKVTNIIDHLPEPLSYEEFARGLYNFLLKEFGISNSFEFSVSEIKEIDELRKSKYVLNDWIYGYSPNFESQGSFEFQGEIVRINCTVKKGLITVCEFNIKSELLKDAMENCLAGKKYDYQVIEKELLQSEFFPNDLQACILQALFE